MLPETAGGMMFEAIIGWKKENCDFAIGESRCQPNCSRENFRILKLNALSFSSRMPERPGGEGM